MASEGRQVVDSVPKASGFSLVAYLSKVKMTLAHVSAHVSFLVWMLLKNLFHVFIFCVHFL